VAIAKPWRVVRHNQNGAPPITEIFHGEGLSWAIYEDPPNTKSICDYILKHIKKKEIVQVTYNNIRYKIEYKEFLIHINWWKENLWNPQTTQI
jgi:hypothetical protein